MLFQELWSK